MASVKSVAITNLDADPSVMSGGGNLSPMMVWHDTYEASSLASGSDITIGRIPAGATIHDVVLKCDDDDRYLAAVGTWNAAGQAQSMLAGSTAANTAVAGLGYKVSDSTDLKITTGGATITGTIYFWVYYTQ